MSWRSRGAGFTLVELLTVTLIMTVLLAILSPVLPRMKRTAQLMVCSSNLRQHSVGLTIHAADQHDLLLGVRAEGGADDRLPEQRVARASSGTRGWRFRVNGWSGIPTLDFLGHPEVQNRSQDLSTAAFWSMYWMDMPAIADGLGPSALSESLISPADAESPDSFARLTELWDPERSISVGVGASSIGVGSYRYTPAALLKPSTLYVAPGESDAAELPPLSQNFGTASAEVFGESVQIQRLSDVRFPAQKTMFFLGGAHFERSKFPPGLSIYSWAASGRTVTTAQADGSVTVVTESGERPLPYVDPAAVGYDPSAGPVLRVFDKLSPNPNERVGLPYALTRNGVRGRDF
ncbi:MAG: prepilin-type N-terminal cleavage/methylation domain-containing protein [Planctomycetota bacterium]